MVKHRWSSRKFWTVNFWQMVSTIMLVMDKVDGGTYSILTAGLIGIYVAGNFADKKVAKND